MNNLAPLERSGTQYKMYQWLLTRANTVIGIQKTGYRPFLQGYRAPCLPAQNVQPTFHRPLHTLSPCRINHFSVIPKSTAPHDLAFCSARKYDLPKLLHMLRHIPRPMLTTSEIQSHSHHTDIHLGDNSPHPNLQGRLEPNCPRSMPAFYW